MPGAPSPGLTAAVGAAALADVTADLLLGVAEDADRDTTTLALPQGATLCLYTDGLVERRDRSLEDGLACLCEAITAGPAETACARAMAELTGTGGSVDDTAVLVIRTC